MSFRCGYNSIVFRTHRILVSSAVLFALLLTFSCKKDINNKDAVKAAVMKRLSAVSGLNMGGMDIDLSSVSFQGDTAEAQVAFKAKGTNDSLMTMSYKLERQGEEWVVKSSSGGFGSGGGAGTGGALPPGHSPMGGQEKK